MKIPAFAAWFEDELRASSKKVKTMTWLIKRIVPMSIESSNKMRSTRFLRWSLVDFIRLERTKYWSLEALV